MNKSSCAHDALTRNPAIRSPWIPWLGIVAILLLAFWAFRPIPVQAQLQTGNPQATTQPSAVAVAPVATAVKDPQTYGLWVLAPAVLAILLTIITREVVGALFVG